MSNPNIDSETLTANANFDAFISRELLPQIGLSQKHFNNLLDQIAEQHAHTQHCEALPAALQPTARELKGKKWGSLFSALYQEDAIPHCAGLRTGQKDNPARSRRVTSSVKDFLDIAFPLTEGSHHDVTSYMVYFQNLRAMGATDLAGIDDVQVEIVESTRSDLEATTVNGKIELYRELMRIAFTKSNPESALTNSDSTQYTGKGGEQYRVSNAGHVVYVNTANPTAPALLTDTSNQVLPTGVVDTLIASLIATTANRQRNADSFDTGPRVIIVSDNTALTLQMLLSVEKTCRHSRVIARPRLTDVSNRQTAYATENNAAADTRAERESLSDPGQTVTPKHSPVNNNEKVTNAEANSINQAVLTALHHHGFELARLSRGLPGDSFGEQHPLQSGTFA